MLTLLGEEYGTILADPPWWEKGGGQCVRGAQEHYDVEKVQDILRIMLASPEWRPARDCVYLQWTTSNHLEDGLWLMRELGFRYVTNVVWVKVRIPRPWWRFPHLRLARTCRKLLQIGLGQRLRHAHELLLLGTRGRVPVPVPAMRLPSVIFAERSRRHSEKPMAQYRYAMAAGPGPYLEMFARERRHELFDVWGNEVE